MAFIFFLIGGIAGVIAMLTSIFVFDASVLTALTAWFATGMAVSLAGVAIALVPRGTMERGDLVEALSTPT